MTRRSTRRHGRLRRFIVGALVLAILAGTTAGVAIVTDAFGAGARWESLVARVDRLIAGPVPDRPTVATLLVTEPPSPSPQPTAASTPRRTAAVTGGTAAPSRVPSPVPTPTPEPVREPVDLDMVDGDPEAFFASQATNDWCAPAGVQMVLALHDRADTSKRTQEEIASRVREWEARSDSLNGRWGPAAMALALEAYGVPGYEVRAFETRQGALRDSARSIQATGAPVVLLAWRGAHTWVMTGFRADADPTVFRDARIEGAYILDPWYPRISSIWGESDPAGAYQDAAELERNFLVWKRPEGKYPDRDGLYITLAPTVELTTARG